MGVPNVNKGCGSLNLFQPKSLPHCVTYKSLLPTLEIEYTVNVYTPTHHFSIYN